MLLLVAALLAPPVLGHLDTERLDHERAGLWTLAGWGAANAMAGAIGHFAQVDEPEWRAFHQMNAMWGVVNAAIAVPSLVDRSGREGRTPDLRRSLEEAHAFERALLLNAGLDVAYLAAGGWLWERGDREADPRQLGFGRSIVLQGAWLLVFDVVMFSVERGHTARLYPLLGDGLAGLGGAF